MKNFIANNIDILISILSVLISFFTAIYLDMKSRQSTLLKERYEKVYYPLYKIFENFFYQYDSLQKAECQDALLQIKCLLEREEMLVGFRLYRTFSAFYENQTPKNFKKFCNLAFNEHITFSKRLGLTGITQKYRAKNRLYSMSGMIFYYAFFILKPVIAALYIFFISIVIYHCIV